MSSTEHWDSPYPDIVKEILVAGYHRWRRGHPMIKKIRNINKLGRCDSYTIEWLNNSTAGLLGLKPLIPFSMPSCL